MRKPKRTTTKNNKLAGVIFRGFEGVGQKLIEVYRGISGLISADRTEMHDRFDRLERIISADRNRKKTR